MLKEFVYDEMSKKSWAEQAAEFNAQLLEEQAKQPREKTELEIMQETLDMVVLSLLGGGDNV